MVSVVCAKQVLAMQAGVDFCVVLNEQQLNTSSLLTSRFFLIMCHNAAIMVGIAGDGYRWRSKPLAKQTVYRLCRVLQEPSEHQTLSFSIRMDSLGV